MSKKSRDSRIATARALHAMAQRGEPNERDNAMAKLEKFMRKHALIQQDIEVWHVRPQQFIVPIHQQWLFAQVVSSILGSVLMLPAADDPTTITINCADDDVLVITDKFTLFLEHYQREEHLFKAAFIQSNALFPASALKYKEDPKTDREKRSPAPPPPPETTADTEDGSTPPPTPPTEDPFEMNARILGMARLVKAIVYHRPISTSGP